MKQRALQHRVQRINARRFARLDECVAASTLLAHVGAPHYLPIG